MEKRASNGPETRKRKHISFNYFLGVKNTCPCQKISFIKKNVYVLHWHVNCHGKLYFSMSHVLKAKFGPTDFGALSTSTQGLD